MALTVRLAQSQMHPPPVELVKLRSHGLRTELEYARNRNWSLRQQGKCARHARGINEIRADLVFCSSELLAIA